MKKFICKTILAASLVFLVGCSTSTKTQVVQMGDEQFTQQQIIQEFAKLDKAEKEIEKKKGFNGTNVAAFLFWLPGLAYTYYDADEALKLIEQRRSHLTSIYNQKYAANDVPVQKGKGEA